MAGLSQKSQPPICPGLSCSRRHVLRGVGLAPRILALPLVSLYETSRDVEHVGLVCPRFEVKVSEGEKSEKLKGVRFANAS